MTTLLLIIYVLVCFAMSIVILLQSSKGGGLAGAFGGGGGGMGAVFGGRGAATFLSRVTSGLAVAFLALALLLSFINREGEQSQSLVEQERAKRSTLPTERSPASGLPLVPTEDLQQPQLPVAPEQTTSSDTAQ
ncbi:preprotein translocase subunit SecG [candidate division KSB1 bacterium]|nr:preprotein translocase subunit SecG [candidate division KSB1 bacterium]NIR71495.1 preprotein translocase subunit SecG [candidate division KSB1 bacterium]NIS23416.1 preprotein translocase subunit SecG [candidate division KSB1 bacterium]NIT70307.1 preprotein translocase subunit SecG [candidate division KSB1 bacterium]NIU24030.1 preprotein translocase subunit SecG [candidate division KSB1 bacterium]